MDTTTLVTVGSVAVNLVLGLLGYLMRDKMETITKQLQTAQEEIVDIKVNYSHKTDVQTMRIEILDAIKRLDDKLDKVR